MLDSFAHGYGKSIGLNGFVAVLAVAVLAEVSCSRFGSSAL